MASGDDLIIRAVAALPIGNLATLMKSGAENYSGSSNIAMRLAALAEPAGICISGALRDAIRDQLPYIFEDIGDQDLDIRGASVHCYAMSADSVASRARVAAENRNHSGKRRRWLRSAAIGTSMFATVGVSAAVLWVWLGVMADNPSRPPKTQQKPQIPLESEQPVTTAVQTASRADDAAALLARGDAFLAAGDITSARLSYERAADAGSGLAALQLGASFDPVFQDRAGLRGAIAEAIQALSWYRRARELGVGEAAQRIKALETRPLGDLYTQSR